jgi:hypothetical protein
VIARAAVRAEKFVLWFPHIAPILGEDFKHWGISQFGIDWHAKTLLRAFSFLGLTHQELLNAKPRAVP